MNKYHEEILKEIKKNSANTSLSNHTANYLGTTKTIYAITVPKLRAIAKEWKLKHPDLTVDQFTELLNYLYQSNSHTEKTFAGKLLEYYPKLRKDLEINLIDRWLNELEGWEEVDSLCQSNFKGIELTSNWDNWEELINKLSKDHNINKRRASLVLLTQPAGQIPDARLSNLSFKVIDALKSEKDILITKAISWLLRSLIKYHKEEVKNYLKENEDSLPKIAVRETENKLNTGKK